MSRYANSYILLRCLHLFVIALLMFGAFSLIPENVAQAARVLEPSDLLKFTAADHVLGFESEGFYVAAGDHMLRVEFAGASDVAPTADSVPSGDGHAQPLGRVTYANLWPGVTLSYDRVAGGIVQSSYLIEPDANVGQIRLCYNAPVEIVADGDLLIGYENGQIRESSPVAWQYFNGRRIPVEVTFCLLDSTNCNPAVGFALGQYNSAYPLMIDPTLEWNTFMGSSDDDRSRAIAPDGIGNVYVAGTSSATWGSPVTPLAGSKDPFVAKLNSNGASQWNTFMGTTDDDTNDTILDIAVDGSGNVYVAGTSGATWGSPINAHSGSFDAFAAKLNSSGVRQWNTFMGSSDSDRGGGIALDGSGNIYVAGYSRATWGSPMNPHSGGDYTDDAFAAKLNSSGVSQWNTFMGSSDDDTGEAIALDGSGNVYVAGYSRATWGSPVNAHSGSLDAFAAKLNGSGVRQWNTFMGSSDYDTGEAIALDGIGNVYVAGGSDATWGSPLNAYSGGSDAFAVKLAPLDTPEPPEAMPWMQFLLFED